MVEAGSQAEMETTMVAGNRGDHDREIRTQVKRIVMKRSKLAESRMVP
jgi:hypothetical protein